MATVNEKMTALADAIRVKTGRTDTLTLDEMIIAIDDIESGTDTSDATATADKIFIGETAYVAGGKVAGTFTIENELTEQNELISQISTLVATKANPQGGTNTSDATATAGDILSGKTAYIKGGKVTGTLNHEDVTEETNAYTDKIASLESAVTALETELQGKASGGGSGSGGSVETCTVNITMSSGYNVSGYGAIQYENGTYSATWKESNYDEKPFPVTLTNVVCNSLLHVHFYAVMPASKATGNCICLNSGSQDLYFLLSADPNETISIELYDKD